MFQKLTVSSTSVGVILPTGTVTRAHITVEDAEIRFRTDGEAPTATMGHLAGDGDVIDLESVAEVKNFRAIRASSDDANLMITLRN